MATPTVSSEDQQFEPHLIRITNHGKIQSWVAFALEFFKEYNGRPLVLHTLPASKPIPNEPLPTSDGEPSQAVGGKCNSTSTIPRLISVTEIIKREYLKTLKPRLSVTGLHQYNEIGYLEEPDDIVNSETRANALALALEGKNYPARKQTAFMRVTLCQNMLPTLVDKGATYQQPGVLKLSKSAGKRMKRRLAAERSKSDRTLG